MRVSLFGGGSDYPAYFHRHPGAVIGFAIDKYIYLGALPLTSAVNYRFRVSYSKVELVDSVDRIEHPVVRTVLKHYGWTEPTDISVQSDLPAAAGLGSSSAFTVGMISLVSHLKNVPRTRIELAREAIYTEQVLLRENVGVQDQLHASFGGINRFDFEGDSFRITPINISGTDLGHLAEWMVLVYTGIQRRATEVVRDQVDNTAARVVDQELREMLQFVEAGQEILENREERDQAPAKIGALLGQSWEVKKRLSAKITAPEIDDLYQFCKGQGAIGGKLCGAGGGGFLLMVVPPDRRAAFEQAVGPRRCLRFRVDVYGTVVTHHSPLAGSWSSPDEGWSD